MDYCYLVSLLQTDPPQCHATAFRSKKVAEDAAKEWMLDEMGEENSDKETFRQVFARFHDPQRGKLAALSVCQVDIDDVALRTSGFAPAMAEVRVTR